MKLLTFRHLGEEQWGVLLEDHQSVLSAPALEEAYFCFLPATLNELIADEEGILTLAGVLQKHTESALATTISIDDIEILPPILPRKNIFAIGKNYPDHVHEFEGTQDAPLPTYPIVFSKLPTAVIGHQELIDSHPTVTKQVDYEGELGIIIGKRCTNVSQDDALSYIFGYTIINDVTARDLQKNHVQWLLGKSLDTFCPMGPYILVNEGILPNFTITTYVNDEERQYGSTEEMIFSIPKIVEILSQGITLEPGDVIATGTPYGVGMGFHPPRFLCAGDTVSITISDIGTLSNTVK